MQMIVAEWDKIDFENKVYRNSFYEGKELMAYVEFDFKNNKTDVYNKDYLTLLSREKKVDDLIEGYKKMAFEINKKAE